MSRARSEIAVAIFHWWMGNPWAVFWAALAMAIVVPPFVSRVAHGVDVVLALLAAAIACVSYVQGTRQMWRRSRSRAALVVALPVLLVTLFAYGANLLGDRQKRVRVYKAEIDVKALGNAVHLYSRHMGRLPAQLSDLTSPATNQRGETGGPFLSSLPPVPPGWTSYRYETRADGTFTVATSGDDRTAAFSSKESGYGR